jgi:hypothetical protein
LIGEALTLNFKNSKVRSDRHGDHAEGSGCTKNESRAKQTSDQVEAPGN